MLALTLASCHSIDEWDNDTEGNFDALWTIIDQHYCFFEQKDIDWDAIYLKYKPKAAAAKTQLQLFDVCSQMLAELRDGHVNLVSWFDTSYYREWWSDYPQDYDERLVEEYYLHFNYKTLGALRYGILEQNVGYINYSSFSSAVGESNLDWVLSWLSTTNGLIIDVRDNGGGDLTNVEPFVSRFIKEKTLVGYIIHKTGTGHSDFSEPYPFYYYPTDGRVGWAKPVVILTNRSTFSAANNFVSIMKNIDGVKIVGATTGGGSGMPLTSELPCGWTVRLSSTSILDARGVSTESGVEPTPGYEVHLDAQAALEGHDTMIDRAIQALSE